MKLIDKLKNVFFEEVEEDEEDEIPKTYAKKVEIPKKKINIVKTEPEEKKIEKNIEEKAIDKIEVKEEKNDKFDSFIEEEEDEVSKVVPMMFDDDDFEEDKNVFEDKNIFEDKDNHDDVVYKRENRNLYDDEDRLYSAKREPYKESMERPSYTYTKTVYHEEKETKGFKPSPIISPIYGILDKNYRKEEVITKRETRISTNYNKPDLDSVRNKAFKELEDEKTKPKKEDTYTEKRKVYDVNNDKPHVNKVTLADAEEYYNDLGLAYNVDYSDASRNSETRSSKYSNRKKEKKDVDDNLFDLIDSMYNKED